MGHMSNDRLTNAEKGGASADDTEHNATAPALAQTQPRRFAKPDYWSNEPLPNVDAAGAVQRADGKESDDLSPTRYGDWVVKGIAVDF